MKTTQEQPKTTEELYKKIWIKSEADLPKVDGIYIANSKIFDKIGFWELRNHENDNYPDYCKNQWLHNIDWYLQPIEQIDSTPDLDCGIYEEKQIEQPELKKKQENKPTAYEWHDLKTGHCYVDYISYPDQGEKDGYTKIPLFKATEQPEQVSPYEGRTTLRPESPLNIKTELTEEEIEKQALIYATTIINGHKPWEQIDKDKKELFIFAAKWHRDQIKVLLRDEHVKFLKWFRGHSELNEYVVKEYLKK
jgi:hypothetical protein